MRHKGSDGGGDGGTVALWQLCVDSTVVLLVSGENRNDDCLLLIEVYNSLLLIFRDLRKQSHRCQCVTAEMNRPA